MTTNNQTHAKKELDILSKTAPDAIILEFADEILAICEKFGQSGQSGGSAPYTASIISKVINKLLMFETISPLTGEDDEWTDISNINDGITWFQNNRDGRVFKDAKDGKAYFLDAIVFNGDLGGTFTGNGISLGDGKTIGSSQYIKSFPFTPKTFYINVIDSRFDDKEETQPNKNGDWWTHRIVNKNDLIEVFEYYDYKS